MNIVFVLLLCGAMAYIVIKLIDIILRVQHNKVLKSENPRQSECYWLSSYIDKASHATEYICVRPKLFKRKRECRLPGCKKMRYKETPPYIQNMFFVIIDMVVGICASVITIIISVINITKP